jgi:2-isopropylmalate synthase
LNAAERFGYKLDKKSPEVLERTRKLFDELRVLEQKGYRLGAFEAEQYILIEKYFGNFKNFFEMRKHKFESEICGKNEKSTFFADYHINGGLYLDSLTINGGPIDAAYKSMLKVLSEKYPKLKNLKLVDFHVGIARRMAEESTVRTIITFEDGLRFKTVGVDEDILESGVEALRKGFNYYLNRIYNS